MGISVDKGFGFCRAAQLPPQGTPLRLLVCGDREWRDGEAIRRVLRAIGPRAIAVVIEGEARGADKLARIAARGLGLEVLAFEADWNRYGKGAGPRRNRQMVELGKPHAVLAFHNDLERSKGTLDMVSYARSQNIYTHVWSHMNPAMPAELVGWPVAIDVRKEPQNDGYVGYELSELP